MSSWMMKNTEYSDLTFGYLQSFELSVLVTFCFNLAPEPAACRPHAEVDSPFPVRSPGSLPLSTVPERQNGLTILYSGVGRLKFF